MVNKLVSAPSGNYSEEDYERDRSKNGHKWGCASAITVTALVAIYCYKEFANGATTITGKIVAGGASLFLGGGFSVPSYILGDMCFGIIHGFRYPKYIKLPRIDLEAVKAHNARSAIELKNYSEFCEREAKDHERRKEERGRDYMRRNLELERRWGLR